MSDFIQTYVGSMNRVGWNCAAHVRVDTPNVNWRHTVPIMIFAAMWGVIFGMFSQQTERDAEDVEGEP